MKFCSAGRQSSMLTLHTVNYSSTPHTWRLPYHISLKGVLFKIRVWKTFSVWSLSSDRPACFFSIFQASTPTAGGRQESTMYSYLNSTPETTCPTNICLRYECTHMQTHCSTDTTIWLLMSQWDMEISWLCHRAHRECFYLFVKVKVVYLLCISPQLLWLN